MEVILSLGSKRIKGMLDQLHQRQSCIHFLGTENLHIISNFNQRVKQEVYLLLTMYYLRFFFLVNIYILVLNDAYMYSNIFLFDME